MKVIEGKENVQRAASEILFDESRMTSGVPSAVFYPESERDIGQIIEKARSEDVPIIGIGGQTGIAGAAVPIEGCFAVCFENMNQIMRVKMSGDSPVLECGPGITLNSIASFLNNPADWDYEVPGSEKIESGKWFYPPDPTEMTAQLGATVATNASGARSFRNGPTRNHVVMLKVVLSGGETLSINRGEHFFGSSGIDIQTDGGSPIHIPPLSYSSPPIKNASGYYFKDGMDLIDLFIGSEGTLGLFTSIGIRLSPMPIFTAGLSFFPTREDAFAFADKLRCDSAVSAIEYFDSTALDFIVEHKDETGRDIPDFPKGCVAAVFWEHAGETEDEFEERLEDWEEKLQQCNSSFDQTWSGLDPAERGRLKAFRHAVPETVNHVVAQNRKNTPEVRKIGTDTAVPGEEFKATFFAYLDLIEENDIQSVIFGHLGDFHLHFNLLPTDKVQLNTALSLYEKMMTLALDAGGTISAEHGVGKIKAGYLQKMYGQSGVQSMREVKRSLDRRWLLNPGTLLE